MGKGTGLALLYGLAGALPLLIAFSVPGGVLFMLLVPLPLFLSGLSLGSTAVLLSATTACGSLASGLADGVGIFLGTAFTLALPVVVLVRQALLNRTNDDGSVEWYPAGLLVMWLTGAGVALLAFSFGSLLWFGSGESLEAIFAGQLTDALRLVVPDAEDAQLQEAAATTAQIGLGLGLDSWLMVIAANGILAQGLPYFFAGLAVVHAACRNRGARTVMLTIFYIILILFAWPAALVAGLGLLDQVIGLRRRLLAAAGKQENE
jgi:hypothetical protein